MQDKTKEELETELLLIQKLQAERVCSDAKYAVKLVEVVVWSMVGTILASVVVALVSLVVMK